MPTPASTVDLMVDRLFLDLPPDPSAKVLDPGCGEGAFIEGVLRWCEARGAPPPTIVGVEQDPSRAAGARAKFRGIRQVRIRTGDFLTDSTDRFDYIIGNPPYVSILGLDQEERRVYRLRYRAATGRFDLYFLFFEQALRLLHRDGRLVFVTPEKFLYVESARALRQLLATHHIESIQLLPEDAFPNVTAYPAITSARKAKAGPTTMRLRDGTTWRRVLCGSESSWMVPPGERSGEFKLGELVDRISCGVATGADEVFVLPFSEVPPSLQRFAFPTVGGRDLGRSHPLEVDPLAILVPYHPSGRLMEPAEMGPLLHYLQARRPRLEQRTCVERKPWYAFHETPVLKELLRPKLLCKDIASEPRFWADPTGSTVPRHSVYYIMPRSPAHLPVLEQFLHSSEAKDWLTRNCQRASSGFLRLQSSMLKELPVPKEVARTLRSEQELLAA